MATNCMLKVTGKRRIKINIDPYGQIIKNLGPNGPIADLTCGMAFLIDNTSFKGEFCYNS